MAWKGIRLCAEPADEGEALFGLQVGGEVPRESPPLASLTCRRADLFGAGAKNVWT